MLYEDLYCARGNCENAIKAVKCDLHSDRTSATTFLANSMRLLLACAAYVLHHALRRHTLQHTALAQAQPSTVILTLFKVATQIKQYKDRILMHLPSSCPSRALTPGHRPVVYGPVPVGIRPDASTFPAAVDRAWSTDPRPQCHNVCRRSQEVRLKCS
jgi:hypothetical protein